MPALMEPKIHSAETATSFEAGDGGGGGVGLRLGGGGGGGNGKYDRGRRGLSHLQGMTKRDRDMALEKEQQAYYETECAIAQEKVRTQIHKHEEQKEKTRQAKANAQTARVHANTAELQTEGARTAHSTEQQKNQSLQHKLGIATDDANFLRAQRPGIKALKAQSIVQLALQLSSTTDQNQHQQQLLTLQGWNAQTGLPAASGENMDFQQGGFNRSGFQLNPINGFGRSY